MSTRIDRATTRWRIASSDKHSEAAWVTNKRLDPSPSTTQSPEMESTVFLTSTALLPNAISATGFRSSLSPPFMRRDPISPSVLSTKSASVIHLPNNPRHPSKKFGVKAGLIGENPSWSEDDYVAIGLSHCFVQNGRGKLQDYFVIEPITASSLECMFEGGATSFKCVMGSTLGVFLRRDLSLLPEEFSGGTFCDNLEVRAKAASRTWKRPYAQENLMNLAPIGELKFDFNFSLEHKRVLNVLYEVKDEDNIKQDMSIDVYGRKNKGEGQKKGDADESLISALYNA